ncbi:MAG TPA: hypothetical protein VJ461_05575, partial [Candidatus Nanoarchaeia archaeon]|nr:hypothetical protein [Candidatus Nanoarchaeia archaeon]
MLIVREPSLRDILFDERGNLGEIVSTCVKDGRVESFSCLYRKLKMIKEYSLDSYSIVYKYRIKRDKDTG